MRPDYDTTLSSEADDASSPLLPLSSSSSHARRLNVRNGTLSVRSDGEHYSYTYTYGPTGLAGLRANTYALRCAMFASLGGLTFGYDQGVIANVLVMEDFVARWPVGPWELGLMGPFALLTVTLTLKLVNYDGDGIAAVLELGCLFGALGAGVLADRVSRRSSIASACGASHAMTTNAITD
jgi:hypothetical protein